MTKEELEKEAEEKAFSYAQLIPCSPYMEKRHREIDFKEGYFAGAEPREKQIETDAKHIRALQKQNGELTDKVKELEEKLANADYQLEGRDNEIRELEAQIEQMKRCSNCKYFYCPTSSKIEKDGKVLFHNWNKEKQAYCDCGNLEGEKYQLWEIKEK